MNQYFRLPSGSAEDVHRLHHLWRPDDYLGGCLVNLDIDSRLRSELALLRLHRAALEAAPRW